MGHFLLDLVSDGGVIRMSVGVGLVLEGLVLSHVVLDLSFEFGDQCLVFAFFPLEV